MQILARSWRTRGCIEAQTHGQPRFQRRLHRFQREARTALAQPVLIGLVFVSACLVSASPPTFYKDVLPILQSRCQNCHREGEMAPMPLETYQQVRRLAPVIGRVTKHKKMPPWFADPRYGRFSNDPSLTPSQVAIFSAWAEAQAPEGNPSDAPAPVHRTHGWNIEKPDAVLEMAHAKAIPAEGD